jgi:Flp pilus assembly protein TadB
VANNKQKPGRVTPKKSASPPARAKRRPVLPKRVGPFERPDASRPLGQVGRRPSSPTKLAVFAVVYLVVGVAAFFVLKGALAVIIGIVLVGIGLLWARGASTAFLRQQRRREEL